MAITSANTLAEMMALLMARPAADASDAELAVWLEAKARLHEHLAAESGDDAAHELELASRAHQRSIRLAARNGR